MDEGTAKFWNFTAVSKKCPRYRSNESIDALTSEPQWANEKTLDKMLETPNELIPRLREVIFDNGQLPQKSINWRVLWKQQPAFIVLSVSLGLILAVGHHMFYLRLNHTIAGSQERQQFAHDSGNFLAISVATLLAFNCRATSKQYFGAVVRR